MTASGAHDARPRARAARDLNHFNQLAEYLIWAVLQPRGVDVYTIIVRCCGATI